MDDRRKKKMKRILMIAVKIGFGSALAIYLAGVLNLNFATSAGSISLLTLVTTKWETVKLSAARVATFFIAVILILAFLNLSHITSDWIVYGVYVFLVVVISEYLGWKATISVNAVIGTHFLTTDVINAAFVLNEFKLLLIGISIAIVLNLFHDYQGQKNGLLKDMRLTEERLQGILADIEVYLRRGPQDEKSVVWEKIRKLEEDLEPVIADAYDYQDNTFASHPGYYIDYFEMRRDQLEVLDILHSELRKIRSIPQQAELVAEYIEDLRVHVTEFNDPQKQIEELEQVFINMKDEPLPKSREEFESRAVLYHVLMDLEEFLTYKKKFIEGLTEEQKRIYWKK